MMDMGTSNTRLWLHTGEQVLCKKGAFGAGTTKCKGREYLFSAVKELIEQLLAEADMQSVEEILVSGMGGSELGLCEIPHIALPADIYTLADNVCRRSIPEITEIPFVFVPGLKKEWGTQLEDIMRGEEVETAGILQQLALNEKIALVLPGTHNKVVLADKDGTITDFKTTLSGELLDNMVQNTILKGQVSHDFTLQEAALLQGARYAGEYGLGSALFHIRILAKNGKNVDYCSSFLYGCILEQDIPLVRTMAQNRKILIGGRENLRRAYSLLLNLEGAMEIPEDISANAVFTGLKTIRGLCRARHRRQTVIDAIAREKLIAIVRAPEQETFPEAVEAIYRGGVRLMEVTFDRSGKIPKDETARLIKQLTKNGRMLAGAGTVTTKEDVWLAYSAGADYIISPNCDPQIIGLTRKLGMVSIPAAFTPTEIAAAIDAGADYIKVFPADQLSCGYVKAVKAPLADAKLLAVGGVDETNAAQYLKMGFCGVGVGAGLYNKELIEKQDWPALEELAKKYINAVK